MLSRNEARFRFILTFVAMTFTSLAAIGIGIWARFDFCDSDPEKCTLSYITMAFGGVMTVVCIWCLYTVLRNDPYPDSDSISPSSVSPLLPK